MGPKYGRTKIIVRSRDIMFIMICFVGFMKLFMFPWYAVVYRVLKAWLMNC